MKEIPFRHIITTNYDDVLESHIFNNKKYTSLIPQSGQEFEISDDESLLIKLHGDCNNTESIVFTQSQYYRFMNNMVYYNSRLQTILAHNTLLMIGYGFGDINIHDVYFKFLDQLESNYDDENPKKSYIVLTDYDRKYFARDEANGGVAIEKDSKYYELYVKFLKSKRIEVIEATDLNQFLLKLYEEYERSTRLTNETVPILLDANKDSIYKIFVDKNYSEMIDLEALGLLVQKTVALDEWIKEKPELRELEIFVKENEYYNRIQNYISQLITDEKENHHLVFIGLSTFIVSSTMSFYEHKNRLKILIDTIESIKLSEYREKELSILKSNELRIFVDSFRDIFNFATMGFGRAWDSHRLLINTLRNEKYNAFELYVWSIAADLSVLEERLTENSGFTGAFDEWYDMKDLLITNSERKWLDEIAKHKFNARIEQLLNDNQRMTSEIRKVMNLDE